MQPTKELCSLYKVNLDFVVSNLKFSIVHHEARVNGTMDEGFEQERDMLKEQLQILSNYEGQNIPKVRNEKMQLSHQLMELNNMMKLSKDAQEQARLQGMCDMHTRFVNTLESLYPLLKEQCPDI